MENRFIELVGKFDGFEAVHGYRDEMDHCIGGRGNTYWIVIMKDGKTKESFVGILEDGGWKDVYIKGSGEKKKTKAMPEGSTIKRITKEAYLAQDENWVTRKQTALIEDVIPRRHYVYGFGEKGLDISEEYGITISWSDINDVPAGFHLRDIRTGDDVELPEI